MIATQALAETPATVGSVANWSVALEPALTHPVRGTILAVDDRPRNLEILEAILAEHGYEVITARSGSQALQSVTLKKPDLILLDIIMPDIDGYEVCRRLKRDPSTAEVSVIFLSSMCDEESVVKGIELGGVDFIAKPFAKAELLARVHTHVTLTQLRHHNRRLLEQQRRQLTEEVEDAKRPLRAIAQNLADITHQLPSAPEQVIRLLNDTLLMTNDALGRLNHDFGVKYNALGPDAPVTAFVPCADLMEMIGKWYQSAHSRRIEFKIRRPAQEFVVASDHAQLGYLVDLVMAAVLNASNSGDAIEVRFVHEDGSLTVSIAYGMTAQIPRAPAGWEEVDWTEPSHLDEPLLREAERLGGTLRFGACASGHMLVALELPVQDSADF